MLPCVIPFVDGVSVDRLVGFEGVGDRDDVSTGAIEKWLEKTSKFILPVHAFCGFCGFLVRF